MKGGAMMEIRQAGMEDMEALVRVRADFLQAFRTIAPEALEAMEASLREYLAHALPQGRLVAVLAREDGAVVGSAFMSVHQRPPSDRLPSGVYGRLTNIYVYPEHRGRGTAQAMLGVLMLAARDQKVEAVELNSAEGAEGLYRKLGFAPADGTHMWKEL